MERHRVLVVEDDRSIREGIADALGFQGYAAVQAERGDVGLTKALHGGCDLVIGSRARGSSCRCNPASPFAPCLRGSV